MKRFTQKDLVVLYLADHLNEWVNAYDLKGKWVKGILLGSEADRRAYEVLSFVGSHGYYEVEGLRYGVEVRHNGKFKQYRAILSTNQKPKFRYEYTDHNTVRQVRV